MRYVIHNHFSARDGGPGSGPRLGGSSSKEDNAKEVRRLRQELSRVDINQPGALKKYSEISAKLEEAERLPRTIKPYEWGKPRDAEPKRDDPAYKRWVEQKRQEQNRGGGSFQDSRDLQYYSGDILWTDLPENEFNKAKEGTILPKPVEGRQAFVIEKRAWVSEFRGPQFRVKVRLK